MVYCVVQLGNSVLSFMTHRIEWLINLIILTINSVSYSDGLLCKCGLVLLPFCPVWDVLKILANNMGVCQEIVMCSLDLYCLLMVLNTSVLNPLHTGRLLHCYMLDESICHFRGCGVYFVAFILFLMGNPVSKQFRP